MKEKFIGRLDMNFVAIDFETAHGNMPCEIGVCVVRNGVVSETKSWLIKPQCFPYMNRWNQQVHGISSDMVKDAETFDTLWYSQIRDYINKELIVAHNAPFDIGVLRATLSHYDLEMPDFRYMCSCQLSRRVWREFPRHSLGELCGRMGIGFNHHRAGDDAEACAKVVIKASERIEVASIADLISFTGTPVKSFKIF